VSLKVRVSELDIACESESRHAQKRRRSRASDSKRQERVTESGREREDRGRDR